MALVEKYDHILQRSNQKQSVNLQELLRETEAAGVLDISNKESKPTMDAFGEQRRFRYEKRKIEMQTIKIGTTDQSKTLRMYFVSIKKKKNDRTLWQHLQTVSSS